MGSVKFWDFLESCKTNTSWRLNLIWRVYRQRSLPHRTLQAHKLQHTELMTVWSRKRQQHTSRAVKVLGSSKASFFFNLMPWQKLLISPKNEPLHFIYLVVLWALNDKRQILSDIKFWYKCLYLKSKISVELGGIICGEYKFIYRLCSVVFHKSSISKYTQ